MKSKAGKILLKIIGITLLLAMLGLVVISSTLIWLSGEQGREWIAGVAEKYAGTEELSIDIDRIASLNTGHTSIDGLTISDKFGAFLIVRRIQADYELRELLAGNVSFDKITVEKAVLLRRPGFEKQDEKSFSFQIPEIRLRQLAVNEIVLNKPVTGREERLSFEGKFVYPGKLLQSDIRARLTGLEKPENGILFFLEFVPQNDSGNMTLKAYADDDGNGPVTSLLGLPSLSLAIDGKGPPENWQGALSLEARGLVNLKSGMALDIAAEKSAAFDITSLEIPGKRRSVFTGQVKLALNKDLSINVDLTGPSYLALKGNVNIPLKRRYAFIPLQTPVKGKLAANLDLGSFNALPGMVQHELAGNIALALDIAGNIEAPEIKGGGKISGASYEHLGTGTSLTGINAELQAQDTKLLISNLTATGPEDGNLRGEGHVDFSDPANPSFEFSGDLEKLKLVSTGKMEITASGNSKVSGNTRQGSLEGNLEINDAEYYISGLGGSTSYSGFTIVEKGASGRVEAEREQTPYVLELALSLKADDGIFVRGPQLETEWAGDIQISGSAHDPKVRGEMRVVRGQFQLLNSPVALNKGKVRFTGPDPANPLLDLSGTIRGKEIDASVNVTGEAKSPEFSLSSDPPLPEDEILARAIFGTTTGNLSPVQALKLANMLSVLSGRGGGGMDPLSRLRQAIGLDTLNIGYEEGGATLSVGKYISEDVYIAVDQGVSPESAGVRAEIDVTRDVEVETKFGSTDNSSVGINWKRDY